MAGTDTHYTYDEDSHCIAIRNGEGETRHFLYDGRGLLIKETAPDDTLHYRYDAAGRLIEVTSATSHVQLEYDLRDRVIREWLNGTLLTRQFDDTARTVTRTLAGEDERDEELTSTFSYSAAGELQQVQLPDGAELTLAHDAAGREASRSGGEFLQQREYDVMGWLTRDMSGQQQDGRLHASQTREYLYDGAGNLAGARHNREAAGYKLDATGRVLSVLSGGAGRTVETDEAYRYTRNGLPQETARLTEWQAGRLTQHDDTHYQYDKAGRLIRKQVVQPGYRPQVWHYRWDSRNQLRVVDTPTGERWFYRYDPFGRRTGKRCEQTSEDIRYLWDGDQIADVRHYRNGALVSRRHWVHNGWELLVQQRQNTDGRWETDFVTSSQNGEPQAVFNPQGELRWRAPKSTLWGQRQSHLEENIDPGLAFAGQYRDTESGLCYNRFRYYDPAGGCYVSPDPIGIAGGDNNYGYVPNPNTWVDPFGLAGCPHAKLAGKIQERANNGKIPKIAPGKISPKGYHGRLSEQRMQEVIKSPDRVYVSGGGNNNIIFAKDGDIVILAGNKSGAYKGQAITSYGPSGPRGDSGAAIHGGLASDPGLPITDSMIVNGQIPKPGGGFLPPAIPITFGG